MDLVYRHPLISINTTMDFPKSKNPKGEQVHTVQYLVQMALVIFFRPQIYEINKNSKQPIIININTV